jgi:hypothetical protein
MRAVRRAGAAAGLALLAGCAPEYNWREIRAADDGYVVMLPDKPAALTRRIDLDGLPVSMSMKGARVGETTFTVAVAALPDATEATRAKALAAMRAGMVRNIAGAERAATPVVVPVIDAAGASAGSATGVRVEAAGRPQGREMALSAGFVARGARAWQWVVMGPAPDREQAGVFLQSFRLLQATP